MGKSSIHLWATLAVFLLFSVSYQAPTDSSWSAIRVGGGGVSYQEVIRGCDGGVISQAEERATTWGAEFEHKFPEGPMVGLRFSHAELTKEHLNEFQSPTPEQAMIVWNPHIALDKHSFGAGIGVNLTDNVSEDYVPSPVSGHLRLGPRDGVAFNLSVSEGAPLWNPGGLAEARIDFPVTQRARFGLGVGSPGPYDGFGVIGRGRIAVAKDFQLNLAGRIGDGAGALESGFMLGLTWVPFHRGAGQPADVPSSGSPDLR